MVVIMANLFVFTVLLLQYAGVIAVAPDDQQSLCTTTEGPDAPGLALVNAYTSMQTPLMDMYWYVLAFGNFGNGVWESIKGSNGHNADGWRRGLNSGCRSTMQARQQGNSNEDNWVATQFISRSTAQPPSYDLPIFVNVTYKFLTCNPRRFGLYYYPSASEPSTSSKQNTSNYMHIGDVVSTNGDERTTSFVFGLDSHSTGFYLAFRDQDSCASINRVQVYRENRVCPQRKEGLVTYPETPTSAIAVSVAHQCADNAVVSGGVLVCNPDGTWSGSPLCSCAPGYRLDQSTCKASPTTPPVPGGCPVHSQRCRQLLENIVNVTLNDDLKQGIITVYCDSPCPALSQQRPECFGPTIRATAQVNGNIICTKTPRGQACGAIMFQERGLDLVTNAANSCAGANCSNTSRCVAATQRYLNHLECCGGTFMRTQPAVAMSLPCSDFVRVHESCPEGTPAPLVITLLNGSPRVSGDSVTAEFSTNKNVTTMQCRLGRGVTEFEDCSSGNVTFTGLTRQDVDEFVLHIQARTTAGEVANLRRVFRIERPQRCSAHLLNSGNLVIGNDVIAEFNGNGPISHYTCFLNGRVFLERCTSPVTFPNLSPGRHVFKITPFGCGINRFPVTFYADIGNVMIEICKVSMTQPIAVQGNSATLHFMGSGPYQSFTCFVDRGGAVYRNCNSPFAVSNLTAGKHFIKIRPDGPGCIPWPNRQSMRVDFNIV